MRKKISIDEIIKAANANIVHKGSYKYAKRAVASGLMSDVLTAGKEKIFLITSLSTSQDLSAILICNNRKVPLEMQNAAQDAGVAILATRENQFNSSYKVYKIINESE